MARSGNSLSEGSSRRIDGSTPTGESEIVCLGIVFVGDVGWGFALEPASRALTGKCTFPTSPILPDASKSGALVFMPIRGLSPRACAQDRFATGFFIVILNGMWPDYGFFGQVWTPFYAWHSYIEMFFPPSLLPPPGVALKW